MKKKPVAIRYRLKKMIEEKEIREERKLPYRIISDEIEVSPNTISSMINQKSEYISRTTLDKFCRYFNCTPGDLIIYIPDEQLGKYKNGATADSLESE